MISLKRLAVAAVLAAIGLGSYRPTLVVMPAPRAALAALNNDSTERFACMYGIAVNRIVVVTRVVPGAMTRWSRASRYWITEVRCPDDALGLAHNHPPDLEGNRRCWFHFPTTVLATSDEVSFLASGMKLAVIVCGDHLVWEVR